MAAHNFDALWKWGEKMELNSDEKKIIKHLVEREVKEIKEDEATVKMPVGMFAAEEEYRRILNEIKEKL